MRHLKSLGQQWIANIYSKVGIRCVGWLTFESAIPQGCHGSEGDDPWRWCLDNGLLRWPLLHTPRRYCGKLCCWVHWTCHQTETHMLHCKEKQHVSAASKLSFELVHMSQEWWHKGWAFCGCRLHTEVYPSLISYSVDNKIIKLSTE